LLISDRGGGNTWSTYSKKCHKAANINVENFHKTSTATAIEKANITDTIFNKIVILLLQQSTFRQFAAKNL